MKTIPAFTLIIGCLLFAKGGVLISQNQTSSTQLLDNYYQATNTEFTTSYRLEATKKMLSILIDKPVDSLLSKSYLLLCDLNSKQQQWDSAYYYSEKLIEYASLKKDTLLIVKGFFRKGYYLGKSYRNVEAFEAYNLGVDYAIAINDSVSVSRILSNAAKIQNNLGDFYGAQESATKGLIYLTRENKTSEYLLNNNLAIAFSNCKNFKNAEEVYLRLVAIANSSQKKAVVLNNLANNYRKQKKYKKAIAIFSEALNDSIKINKAETIARLKDNMGYTLFQWKGKEGLSLMLASLHKRKEIQDFEGQFASNIHLINYYSEKNEQQAIVYAQNAVQVAKNVKSPDMRLEALSYLIKLNPTKNNTEVYVTLNDSITTAKLLTQNKYAGILYKSEEKEKQNLQLQQENIQQELALEKEKLRKWILTLGLLLVVIISFLIWRKYKAEAKAKQTISLQKDKIEAQKNMVEKLQREMHHRLKNNLLVIDMFIGLAKGKFTNKAYQEKLNELQNRISSMFAIHTQLIEKEDITSVNAKNYIVNLTKGIVQVYNNPLVSMLYKIEEEQELVSRLSFPMGLIINEFVSNSYKYAFQKEEKGIITVELKSDATHYYLSLSDNGKGLPKDFNIDTLTSFGIDIIKLLTEEYHGKFQLHSFEGVQLKIILPKQTN